MEHAAAYHGVAQDLLFVPCMMPARLTMLSGCAVALLLVLVCPLRVAAPAVIYQWMDPQGRVWFSDIPPALTRRAAPSAPASSEAVHSHVAPVTTSSGSITVPLYPQGAAFVVDTVLNARVHLPLVVDTGADITVLPAVAAHRLGIDLRDAATQPVRIAGYRLLTRRVVLTSLAVGPAIVRQVEVLILEDGMGAHETGFLGMSFLRHFTLTLDPTRPALTLTPLAGASP